MKRDFEDENFEDFLRHNADGLRMRPSDKVWKDISHNLDKRKRRGGILFGSFIAALSLISGYFLFENNKPSSTFLESKKTDDQKEATSFNSNTAIESTTPVVPLYPSSSITKRNTAKPKDIVDPVIADASPVINLTGSPQKVLSNEVSFSPTIVDSYIEEEAALNKPETSSETKTGEQPIFPATIESVVNSYKPRLLKKKVRWQVYFTPTVSYRRLAENKAFLLTQPDNTPVALAAANHTVNSMVNHRPALGLELGVAAKYGISRKLNIRAGLQLNINRYAIMASNSNTESATIMLNTGLLKSDSMSARSGYRNADVSGGAADWLYNVYYQVSAPVGVEWKFAGNKKVKFGIATTIQPTYVLGDQAYLISSDYTKYAEVPDFTRRWNVNTSLETFVNYSTGTLAWQVGPQVRYQLLSSFITKYPVKENLFDFGLRIGVSLNK